MHKRKTGARGRGRPRKTTPTPQDVRDRVIDLVAEALTRGERYKNWADWVAPLLPEDGRAVDVGRVALGAVRELIDQGLTHPSAAIRAHAGALSDAVNYPYGVWRREEAEPVDPLTLFRRPLPARAHPAALRLLAWLGKHVADDPDVQRILSDTAGDATRFENGDAYDIIGAVGEAVLHDESLEADCATLFEAADADMRSVDPTFGVAVEETRHPRIRTQYGPKPGRRGRPRRPRMGLEQFTAAWDGDGIDTEIHWERWKGWPIADAILDAGARDTADARLAPTLPPATLLRDLDRLPHFARTVARAAAVASPQQRAVLDTYYSLGTAKLTDVDAILGLTPGQAAHQLDRLSKKLRP